MNGLVMSYIHTNHFYFHWFRVIYKEELLFHCSPFAVLSEFDSVFRLHPKSFIKWSENPLPLWRLKSETRWIFTFYKIVSMISCDFHPFIFTFFFCWCWISSLFYVWTKTLHSSIHSKSFNKIKWREESVHLFETVK